MSVPLSNAIDSKYSKYSVLDFLLVLFDSYHVLRINVINQIFLVYPSRVKCEISARHIFLPISECESIM